MAALGIAAFCQSLSVPKKVDGFNENLITPQYDKPNEKLPRVQSAVDNSAKPLIHA